MALAPHLNTVRDLSAVPDIALLPTWLCFRCTNTSFYLSAEFRGPGVHHNFDDSGSGYDNDSESKGKSFGIGGYKGRIIFLGDGTEVLTDSDDTEMFDNSEEDKDLASQVEKGSSSSSGSDDKDHQVIGSPVTPEKLDSKMNVDQKAGGSESVSGSEEGTQPEDKKIP